ncbi:SH3 domain-containing protein [Variovorax sp. PAMC26660]|uniref:SH3 domain-containing protein n=1 Tax=Variovorax sp. PAMC26660 TaxID=2762322 RepID=UPI00164DF860|nr:SH3 domain-containing protein [Variovorax sp. PAMC26660]QNK70533.1 SH3 domain-containing protein [Variovorax sp. PAMC26660]
MNPTLVPRWIGIGALALVLPLAASAQQAFTRGTVNLRAGPSGDYPLVARLAPGQSLDVVGCTSGYGWCDVVLPDGGRGWVWAKSLDYAYQEQRVPLAAYGAVIGVPIVSFVIGNYWANYYRDRPWYGDRRWWGNRPPPPMAGWRPPPPVRPGWQPRPWQPGPGFRPPGPGFRPGPGPRPPVDPGFRPPRPQPGFRPGPPPGMPHPHPGGGRPGGGGGHPHGGGGPGGHRP